MGTVTKNALEPFTLEHFGWWASQIVLDNDELWALEPFQEEFVADLFSGRRISWLVIPEGNGKTTLMAGLGLYFCEFKPHATVLAAAAAVEQASIMYSQAEGMVLRTPRLHAMTTSAVLKAKGKRTTDKPLFECLEGWKRINCANGARFQIKPADDISGDGVIPDVCFIDELHRHRNLKLYRTWAGKLRKRNGQLVVISTAGVPGGEFETTREGMRQSADELTARDCFVRAASESWVLHDWAVPEGADVEDLSIVLRANPLSLVTRETLRETWETPGMTLEHWSRINANVPTRSSSAAIQEREWMGAAESWDPPEDADIWLGMDVGWKWDTTAIVPFWWLDDGFRMFGPASILEPPRNGDSLSPELVKGEVLRLMREHRVSTVVMDTSKAEDVASWISDQDVLVVERSQSAKPQAEDYQRFMEALRGGKLKHSGDMGLKQHALNAVTKMLPDDGARFARSSETRQGGSQESRVIDALVAAAMVHSYAVETHSTEPQEVMVAWA